MLLNEKYKNLTTKQIDYLLTAPNNYYFRKISPELKEDLEALAKENGYYLVIENLPEEEKSRTWNLKKRGRKKCAGYIARFYKLEKRGI